MCKIESCDYIIFRILWKWETCMALRKEFYMAIEPLSQLHFYTLKLIVSFNKYRSPDDITVTNSLSQSQAVSNALLQSVSHIHIVMWLATKPCFVLYLNQGNSSWLLVSWIIIILRCQTILFKGICRYRWNWKKCRNGISRH